MEKDLGGGYSATAFTVNGRDHYATISKDGRHHNTTGWPSPSAAQAIEYARAMVELAYDPRPGRRSASILHGAPPGSAWHLMTARLALGQVRPVNGRRSPFCLLADALPGGLELIHLDPSGGGTVRHLPTGAVYDYWPTDTLPPVPAYLYPVGPAQRAETMPALKIVPAQ